MSETKRSLDEVAAYFDEVFELDAPYKSHPLSPYAAAVREAIAEIHALTRELEAAKKLLANPSQSNATHYELGRSDERQTQAATIKKGNDMPTLNDVAAYFDDRATMDEYESDWRDYAATVREAAAMLERCLPLVAEATQFRSDCVGRELIAAIRRITGTGCARCEGTDSIGVTFATGRAESERCPDCQKGDR